MHHNFECNIFIILNCEMVNAFWMELKLEWCIHMGGIGANGKSISFCVVNQYQYDEHSLAGGNT